MAVSNRDVRRVQVAYPRIYFACHTRHIRRKSSGTHLSPTDSSLLAHLDDEVGVRPTVLARHLDLAASTLSAALHRLAEHGYVTRGRESGDRRSIPVRLTPKGVAAMQATSTLDTDRVRRLLGRLSPVDRTRALDGLALLARAASTGAGT